jgi:hypothetical protein
MGLSTTPTTVARLVRTTNEHFLAAQAAQKKLDWVTYGREMKAVQAGLQKLLEATKSWQGVLSFSRLLVK